MIEMVSEEVSHKWLSRQIYSLLDEMFDSSKMNDFELREMKMALVEHDPDDVEELHVKRHRFKVRISKGGHAFEAEYKMKGESLWRPVEY
jgi:hypothetical protein